MEETYVCDLDLESLAYYLRKIAPQCPDCESPMLDICIEQCCLGRVIVCRDCSQNDHFLHRTNDMRVFLIDPELLYTRGSRLAWIEGVEQLSLEIKRSSRHLSVIKLCDQLTAACSSKTL